MNWSLQNTFPPSLVHSTLTPAQPHSLGTVTWTLCLFLAHEHCEPCFNNVPAVLLLARQPVGSTVKAAGRPRCSCYPDWKGGASFFHFLKCTEL